MHTPHIFQGYGIELEYMIVDRRTLNVLPIADRILEKIAGAVINEVERGRLAWSNELVLHVIELKTLGPAESLNDLHTLFQEDIREINAILSDFNACLMPSAMHPWMEPGKETVLWPHDSHEIYEAYNSIFSCQGHGWSNLQSTHINLAFNGDLEFSRLHSAIRLVLPILPAIAASSPIVEGSLTGMRDTRLHHYRRNQRLIPSIGGVTIPEAVLSRSEYEQHILQRIYQDIRPHDPKNILQYEWLNSRGAIARFDRNSIEIRLLDVQECPLADISIAVLIVEILKKIAAETWIPLAAQAKVSETGLAEILTNTILDGEGAMMVDAQYLECFGLTQPITAGALWAYLADQVGTELHSSPIEVRKALEEILSGGTLSSRITKTLPPHFSRKQVTSTYAKLADCLQRGEIFRG